MNNETTETCMFFIDDSNIWIEAQKFAASGNSHMPKLTDSDRDPRLRIDVGKLIDTLRKDRVQGRSFLYGSRPPPNDSVWKAYEKFRFQTKIYDRSQGGKEKEVDNSMATDLSSEATELSIRAEYDPKVMKQKNETVFVAITGDRDMLPAIKKVLKHEIRVELWAWRSGISKDYQRLSYDNSLLSVEFMDGIFGMISFTNFQSTRQNKSNHVDPGQAIVLCEFGDLSLNDIEHFICDQLLQLGRLFYITRSQTETEMFVEFPKVENIEAMVLKAGELFDGILKVRSWPEYANSANKNLPVLVETSNMYTPLTGENGQFATTASPKGGYRALNGLGVSDSGEIQGLKDPDNNDGWQTVARSDLGKDHRRGLRQTQRCPERIRCKKRGECGYRHTDEERDLFRDMPNQNFGLWKTKACNNVPYCRRGKRCGFAHSAAEAWCLRCRLEGHYTEKCRYKG
ncbi:uncharacterized protein E0L32_010972 [Thyridium curvatum]|uniref:Uncharacterized protein n=1 Tax=Thyridium curvatum TaxID=1093900 RepID=A0A507AJN5_9PEZI|nr:uncharacterized protein E0L32_010972 [Thyridium curvatum]TPX07077.1 hypothetical protein E0L32_010972 [Thyridium curvatum]